VTRKGMRRVGEISPQIRLAIGRLDLPRTYIAIFDPGSELIVEDGAHPVCSTRSRTKADETWRRITPCALMFNRTAPQGRTGCRVGNGRFADLC